MLEGETGLKYRCAELCAVNDANLGGTWQKNFVLKLDITDVMQKAFFFVRVCFYMPGVQYIIAYCMCK